MADFKELIDVITKTVNDFSRNVPAIQQRMLNDLMLQLKKLDTRGDSIRISGANLKVLTDVKARLQAIILSPEYKAAVKKYAGTFEKITEIQNSYFSEVESKFKPPKLAKEIRRQAMLGVVNQLTEAGLAANVTDKVQDLLRKAVTSGGSYANLQQGLADFLTNNQTGDGQLVKYTKQIASDAMNQFSGQYTQLISADLGFEWFRYSGSNLTTTRPFCLACTDRKYFHISEMQEVLQGNFHEFSQFDGKINKKTGLPEGMIAGTDVTNFQTNRGGYNCGHQWRPVSDDQVPDAIKKQVYKSVKYKAWAVAARKGDVKRRDIAAVKEAGPIQTAAAIAAGIGLASTFTKDVSQNHRQELSRHITTENYRDIVKHQNGGVSAVSKLADVVDLEENVKSAELYARLIGYIAEVNKHVRKPGIKNPELTLNGKIADNKIPNHSDSSKGTEPYKNIASAISNAAKSAINQEAIPVIVLERRYNLQDIIKGVGYGFAAVGKSGKKASEIHLRYRTKGITIITRKEFEDGDYVELIQKGYHPPV